MYENIPQTLKELTQWVCWSMAEREGKKTKIPIPMKKLLIILLVP